MYDNMIYHIICHVRTMYSCMFFFLVNKCIHFLFIKTDFDLSEDETCRATIRMFVDFNLVGQFHIPYDVSITCKNYVEKMSK